MDCAVSILGMLEGVKRNVLDPEQKNKLSFNPWYVGGVKSHDFVSSARAVQFQSLVCWRVLK